jgi:hypothetical protein
MASQVLSGSGSLSYTNNTGQNVRVVINFLGYYLGNASGISLSWAGNPSITADAVAIGRNLAISGGAQATGLSVYANNMIPLDGGTESKNSALPTELMLAPGQSFSCGGGSSLVYNIVIIPENG